MTAAGRSWLLRVGAGVAVAALVLSLVRARSHRPVDRIASDAGATPNPPAGERGATVPPALIRGASAQRDAAGTDAPGVALDCARAEGDVARVDGDTITARRLCDRLRRMGAVRATGVDRQQSRWVLDQLVDATLVRRALAFERAAVSEAETDAALAPLLTDAGGARTNAADTTLLREQLRERLELRALLRLRRPFEVTEEQVAAELARGAPGIDRGQGVRVEGWIARTPPTADAGEDSPSQRAAEAFALALRTDAPEAAAARLGMARLPPFVVGVNGVEPDLERVALALPEGRWSEAVRTRVGWAVLRVMGRVEGERIPDGVLRARVRAALEGRALQGARASVLAALRDGARIEVLVAL